MVYSGEFATLQIATSMVYVYTYTFMHYFDISVIIHVCLNTMPVQLNISCFRKPSETSSTGSNPVRMYAHLTYLQLPWYTIVDGEYIMCTHCTCSVLWHQLI